MPPFAGSDTGGTNAPTEDDEEFYSEQGFLLNSTLIESFEVVVAGDYDATESQDTKAALKPVRIYHRTVSLKSNTCSDMPQHRQQQQHENALPVVAEENDPSDTDNDIVMNDSHDNDNDDSNGVDTVLDALLYGCVGCEPLCGGIQGLVPRSQVKSILKKKAPSTVPPPPQSLTNHRTVSFNQIEIKEFKMTLGDHPSARSGPPVRIDWNSKPVIDRVVSLDEYELSRKPLRRTSRKQLKLSYNDRKGILMQDQGFTQEEVNAAWNEALAIRKQRYETIQHGISPFQINMDAFVESVQRKYKRMTDHVISPSVSFS